MAKKSKMGQTPRKPSPLLHTITTDHKNFITALCFLPGDRFLASGSSDGTIRLWNVHTPGSAGLWTMGPRKWGVTKLALSPDGYTLAAISEGANKPHSGDTQALLVNLAGDRRSEFTGMEINDDYRDVAFSPAGNVVAFAMKEIRLLDINSFEPIGDPLPKSQCSRLVFLDGTRLLAGSFINGEVREWDISTRTRGSCRQPHEKVVALTASPDGTWAASAGEDDSTICFWETGVKANEQSLKGDWERTDSLTILPDNETLLSLNYRNGEAVLRIWSLGEATHIREWQPKSGQLRCIAVSQDGRRLATATVTNDRDHLIEVWDMQAIRSQL